MTIVLDTSVLIDALRGNEPARTAIRSAALAGELLAISTVTRVELLAGVRPREESALRALLGELVSVPVDDPVAERAGLFARQYQAAHSGIDTADYIIAATAAELDAALWTINIRDFPMFAGLQRPY